MAVLNPPVSNSIVSADLNIAIAPVPGTQMPPLVDSAVVYEYSYSTGTGPYTLAGAFGSWKPLSSSYADGAPVYYRATDQSGQTEYVVGTFNAGAGTLSRDMIVGSTNDGNPIDWTGRTRVLVHALIQGLPLCATPPTDGQVLVWDGTQSEWCPASLPTIPPVPPSFAVCPTPPLDGQVLVWSLAENAYCPADFCVLVAPCMTPAFSYGAVTFDGETYLDNFPVMADSPRGFISVWLKGSNIFNGRDNGWLFKGPHFFCYADQYAYGANTWFFQMWDSPTNTSEFQWATATAMSTTDWVHVLMSWDMDSSGNQVFQLFFNDTQIMPHLAGELGGSPPEDMFSWPATFGPMPFTIAYSTPDSGPFTWRWGDAMSVDMSEAVFAPGQFLDFSDPANRAKFRDPTTHKPIYLGADGSLPTGVAPTLYLHISAAETNADRFADNLSGGGPLSIVAIGAGLTIATPP